MRHALLLPLLFTLACTPSWEGEWTGDAADCSLDNQDFGGGPYEVELNLEQDGDLVRADYRIRDLFSVELELDDTDLEFAAEMDGFEVEFVGEADVEGQSLDAEFLFELEYADDERTEAEGTLTIELEASGERDTIACTLELEK